MNKPREKGRLLVLRKWTIMRCATGPSLHLFNKSIRITWAMVKFFERSLVATQFNEIFLNEQWDAKLSHSHLLCCLENYVQFSVSNKVRENIADRVALIPSLYETAHVVGLSRKRSIITLPPIADWSKGEGAGWLLSLHEASLKKNSVSGEATGCLKKGRLGTYFFFFFL